MDETAQSTSGLSAVTAGAVAFMMSVFLIYGLHRLWEVFTWLKIRNHQPAQSQTLQALPNVTVQIPFYNEPNVAERVIRAVAELDYPSEQLEIQILDDSTDQTSRIVTNVCTELNQQGNSIQILKRDSRQGYKAGALNEALKHATADFILIFDADFVPHPALLKQMIHHFSDPSIGMVQAAWSHLNADTSLLTQVQSVYLDAHFQIENHVRSMTGRWFNFNGTAGIWRKQSILDAGGWSGDTLSEDVDLSYRAQMAGWKMCFLKDIQCDAEIPSQMSAFQSQQHRWSKGLIQNARKHLSSILKCNASWRIKLEAFFHLTSPGVSVFVVLGAILLMLTNNTEILQAIDSQSWLQTYSLICGSIAMTSVFLYYLLGGMAGGRSMLHAAILTPMLIALGIGMSLNNARGVSAACLGIQSAFTRTPKQGHHQTSQSPLLTTQLTSPIMLLLQWAFTLMLGYTFQHAILSGSNLVSIALQGLFLVGFAWVAAASSMDNLRILMKKTEN